MPHRTHGRLLERLGAIVSRDERLIVGLSSGTSFDGIDAALVRATGWGGELEVNLLHFVCVPLGGGLRARIASASRARAEEIARLNFDLGEAFAAAALALIEASGHEPADVHLIGSHGQTVSHVRAGPGGRGATLQIGEADVIADRTGVLTVSDFRTADVAAGGSGAPLIPLVDWLLFRLPGSARLMVNIGGIANVTYVADALSDTLGFDTGPGNALVDEIVRAATGGRDSMDAGGAGALRGSVSERAVSEFLGKPYFSAAPPKSTGKETFGRDAAAELAGMVHPGRILEDMSTSEIDDALATAATITARSIRDATSFLPSQPALSDVVVSGGGVKNEAIMTMLSDLFAPCPVITLERLGMDPDAKEAVGFAVLANESIFGSPGNLPAVTGASRSVVLGKLSPGL